MGGEGAKGGERMRSAYLSSEAIAHIQHVFPAVKYDAEAARPALFIEANEIIPLLLFLRDEKSLALTRMENVTAVDWKDHFEMVYHLFSPTHLHWATVKVTLSHERPVIASATAVFPGAEFEEREVYDLMGIAFTDHPDLRRILLPDTFVGHPLRKDFAQPPPPAIRAVRREGE